jgi:hypothetical protein
MLRDAGTKGARVVFLNENIPHRQRSLFARSGFEYYERGQSFGLRDMTLAGEVFFTTDIPVIWGGAQQPIFKMEPEKDSLNVIMTNAQTGSVYRITEEDMQRLRIEVGKPFSYGRIETKTVSLIVVFEDVGRVYTDRDARQFLSSISSANVVETNIISDFDRQLLRRQNAPFRHA